MKTGEYFGEAALFVKTKRRATVTALETVLLEFFIELILFQTQLLCLKRDELQAILGVKLDHLLFRNYHLWAIETSQYLKKLTQIQINKLIDEMTILEIKKGEVALKKG